MILCPFFVRIVAPETSKVLNMAAEEREKSEDFDVKEFFSSCKLDDYYTEFISLGYDCLEQISQMDEAQLNELTADVRVDKKLGHKMRFVAKTQDEGLYFKVKE